MNFLQRYEQIVLKLRAWSLSASDIDDALMYANLYGVVRSINNDGTYADDELEQLLTTRILGACQLDIKSISAARGNGALVLTTELYDFGGHTKVLITWLKLMKDVMPHKLVVTRSLTAKIEAQITKLLVDMVKIPNGGLRGVMSIIAAAQGFNRIVLHTHSEDIVSAIAARILADAGYEIIFYNHADHLFSFGLSTANTVCEISSFGEAINRRTQRVKGAAVRLGIPLKNEKTVPPSIPETTNSVDGSKIILSVGNSYKYKPETSFLFADFIDEILLRRRNIRVVLVGSTGQEKWWLARRKNWGDRVQFMGILSHSEYIGLLEKADIYLDSYPITGGTAFPEALLAGKSCIGLSSPMQGYSLADSLKVSSVGQLVHHTEMILDEQPELLLQQEILRKQVANSQSEDAFKSLISDIYMHQNTVISPNEVRSDMAIDSYFLEEKWHSRRLCNLPKKLLLTQLPLYRSIQLFSLMQWSNFLGKNKKIAHAK